MNYCPKCKAELVKSVMDNKERLRCSDDSCGFVFWNNPLPVVAMVVETDQGILLAHNKFAPKGVYSVITGFLEADETTEAAAVRETLEELGLVAIATSLIGIYPFKKANQIVIAYHIQATGTVCLNDELDDFIIVKKEDLIGWTETGRFEVGEWLNRLRVLRSSASAN